MGDVESIIVNDMEEDKEEFQIGVPEIHIDYHTVEAESMEEAIEIVQQKRQDGEFGHLEYSHTKDMDEWLVS